MDALNYLEEKTRMTNGCEIECYKCPLTEEYPCATMEKLYPERCIEIVEQWSKKNPIRTYLSDLLEKYPNISLSSDKTFPNGICPSSLGLKNLEGYCSISWCKFCWSQRMPEDTLQGL